MENVRFHGSSPYLTMVVHGGPGAPGTMAPVAEVISEKMGVLEPFQTRTTIRGLIDELGDVIEAYGSPPMTIIGHSWGAWLSLIFASLNPSVVEKLIIIGSGPLECPYCKNMMETRMGRLGQDERTDAARILSQLEIAGADDKGDLLSEFGRLMSKADSYDAVEHGEDAISCDYDAFRNVWREAEKMRNSGKLLELAGSVLCPVVAIHGDHDTHDPEGVRIPLSRRLMDFKFILLERCGHEPWYEKHAKDRFYAILMQELGSKRH